jgi:hypothetical protein
MKVKHIGIRLRGKELGLLENAKERFERQYPFMAASTQEVVKQALLEYGAPYGKGKEV